MVFGVDLTASPAKPSACLGLDNNRQPAYFGFANRDDDVISIAEFYSLQVVAIDAPLSLPTGLCCLEENCPCQAISQRKNRQCDQELRRQGIPFYPTTKKTFIKSLIYRGIKLKNKLIDAGFEVIEIYPYASKVCLFGKAIPRKSTPEGIAFLRQNLERILPGLKPYFAMFDHNLCDAAVAAYTAFLYREGMTDALGNSDEGLISIPHVSNHLTR